MLDTEKFINSLKASWIKRLLDNNNKGMWKIFYNEKIKNFGGKLIFESNLDKNDINTLFPKNDFLQDIITAWSKINFNKSEKTNIGKEFLWNNSFIKTSGRPIFNKVWFDRGIQLMEHIYDFRKREFFNFNDIINLYDIPNHFFLFYNTLVSSIPLEWKNKLKTEQINIPKKETLLIKCLKQKHVNKYLYECQFQNEGKMDVKQEKKWDDILNETVLDWKNMYLTPI